MGFKVDGPTSRGRPNLKWRDIVNADLRKKHLNISLASSDRQAGRQAVILIASFLLAPLSSS